MKKLAFILVFLIADFAFGQGWPGGFVMGKDNTDQVIAEQNQRYAQGRASALSRDPWRKVNGTVVRTTASWMWFYGTVLEVQPTGIRVNGSYSSLDGRQQGALESEFFVANFPYQVAEGDVISGSDSYLALPAGVYTYTTVLGGNRTIHELDYGVPCAAPPPPPPPSPEQIAAAKAKAASAKKAADEKALKYDEDLAAKGDAFGLLRMGERYRDGDGVTNNLALARDYLQRAAKAGDSTAADELKKLPAK
jgi:hypothetical protein